MLYKCFVLTGKSHVNVPRKYETLIGLGPWCSGHNYRLSRRSVRARTSLSVFRFQRTSSLSMSRDPILWGVSDSTHLPQEVLRAQFDLHIGTEVAGLHSFIHTLIQCRVNFLPESYCLRSTIVWLNVSFHHTVVAQSCPIRSLRYIVTYTRKRVKGFNLAL